MRARAALAMRPVLTLALALALAALGSAGFSIRVSAQSALLLPGPGPLQGPAIPLEMDYLIERDADLALHLDSVQAMAVQQSLRRFAGAFIGQSMFRPARAFHTVFVGSLVRPIEGGLAGTDGAAPGRLLVGAVGVDLNFAELAYRRRQQGTAEDQMLDIRVNAPEYARGRRIPQLPASYVRQPRETGRIGRETIYENEYVIVTARDPATLWRPVAVERVLREYLAVIESGRQNADRQLAAAVARAEEGPDSARLAAANPSSATREGRWYWSWHEAGDSLRARLATMTRDEGDAPACWLELGGLEAATQFLQVVHRGTPRCAPIVELNPDFLRRDLPRSAIQVAVFTHVVFCMRTMQSFTPQMRIGLRSGCAAVLRMMSEANWGAVRKTLDR